MWAFNSLKLQQAFLDIRLITELRIYVPGQPRIFPNFQSKTIIHSNHAQGDYDYYKKFIVVRPKVRYLLWLIN